MTDCEDSECCLQNVCLSNPMCINFFSLSLNNSINLLVNDNIDFFDKIKFLFNNNNSHQRYVDKNYLDKKRVSVIRGRVLSSLGGALSGVRVSDERNSYAGFSVTQNGNNKQKGIFNLVVNSLIFLKKILIYNFIKIYILNN